MTERATPHFLVVGHINKPHGTKGEVFVWTLTDHPESVFAPGVVLLMGDESGGLLEGRPTLRLESCRPFRKGLLVCFEGCSTRNHADQLRGYYLLRAAEELQGREPDELFYHELLDLDVVTVGGEELGRVREVYELRPAHMLDVHGPTKSHMIPFLKEIVVDIDLDAGVLTIDPPLGLLDV